LHEFALQLCALQLESRREQKLASTQPRRGVEQLGGVHPAHAGLRVLLARGKRQVQLGDEALDGQHLTTLRLASPNRRFGAGLGRRTGIVESTLRRWLVERGAPPASARADSIRAAAISTRLPLADPLPRLAQHGAQDALDLLELLAVGD